LYKYLRYKQKEPIKKQAKERDFVSNDN